MKLESTISEKAGFLYTAPLIDAVLLLLVFFVFGSSFVLKSGVQVNLPTSKSSLQDSSNSHIVTVMGGSVPKIYFNEARVDMSQLESKLQTGKVTASQITILADRNSEYGFVMEAAILALNYGYQVSFGTKPSHE